MTTILTPVVSSTKPGEANKPGKLKSSNKSLLSPPLLPAPGQKDACYKSSLLLVEWIDASLGRERVHFRNRAGELLQTLDQVIRAIIDNDLMELAG